jgi:hypothetical protein
MVTRPPADGRGGGRDLTLAVLAARLSELAGQVGGLAARVDSAEAAIGEQEDMLARAADLAREVARLSAALAGQQPGPGAEFRPEHPRRPVWAVMKEEEYVDALRALARWVSEILLPRHPHAAPALPPCWPAHPAVVEELDWLYWDWTCWALNPQSRSRDAADWHDRWLPGVLVRVRPLLAPCATNAGHRKPDYRRPIPPALVADGHAPEALFIEQMRRARRAP